MPSRRRRARGDGAVYKRGDGRWAGVVDLGWDSGKRRRKYVYGKTQAEAIRNLRAAQRQLDETGDVTTSAPTVGNWLTHWVNDIAPARVKVSTLTSHRGYVTRYLVPLLGKHRLDKLRPDHIRGLHRELATRGLSPATQLQAHAVLSRALTVAVKDGRIPRNPAALVDRPTLRAEPKGVALTADETRAVLLAAAGDRLEVRWWLALMLALRQGEALGLQWGDVDLDQQLLTVRRSLARIPRQGLVLTEPKSARARRTLPMPAPLLARMRLRYVAAREEDTAAAAGHVVCRPDGRPVDPREDYEAWRRLLDKAGVRHVRLHDARHSALTMLAAAGVHTTVAQHIAGHSTPVLTQQVYTHPDLPMMRDALGLVGDVLELPPGAG